jgi:arylformamidase
MREALKYWEISPRVREGIAVFPGDTPYVREELLHFSRGHHLSLSKIHCTVHLGAHADAPIHYHRDGVGIAERDLAAYFGACEVMRVRAPRGERIGLSALQGRTPRAPRVLLQTDSFADPYRWTSDFNGVEPELVEYLASCGVRLIGVDTPSLDLADDKELRAHQVCFSRDLSILEGLVLGAVPEGIYSLVALPLALEGADAAPVRAILVESVLGELCPKK